MWYGPKKPRLGNPTWNYKWKVLFWIYRQRWQCQTNILDLGLCTSFQIDQAWLFRIQKVEIFCQKILRDCQSSQNKRWNISPFIMKFFLSYHRKKYVSREKAGSWERELIQKKIVHHCEMAWIQNSPSSHAKSLMEC